MISDGGVVMYEWENAFNQTILERGKKYANGNRVKIISTDYKTTSAVVRGSQQYNVSVRLTKAGGFAGGSCDCPYAMDHHRCKHMAAVLYKSEQTRGSLERAMTRLEALNAEPENNSFFRELDYLLLDYLPIMIDGDVEKLVLAVLRTVISRPCITENMTADIRRLCVAILVRTAQKSTAKYKSIHDELLSMASEADTPEGVGFILRTAFSALPEEKTYDAFADTLINRVPDSLNPIDALEILGHLYKPEMVKRAYERLMNHCRETGTTDQLIKDIKDQLSDSYWFNCSLALTLKEFTPKDEWPEVYAEILSAGDMCSEKYAFMFLENDYDRLMDSIEQYDTYGYNFEKYEKELKKALPGRALVYRVSIAERALATAKNKRDYREAVKLLKKSSSYPDGKEMVAAAAKFWRENNPKKTSLLEALDRARL